MKQWYALHTKSKAEYQTARILRTLGIETYLPEITVSDKHQTPQKQPFFPNYLFANIDFETVGLSKVRRTPGLRTIVSANGLPVSIPNEVVTTIGQKLSKFRTLDELRTHTFQSGDTVQIVSGPFQDMLAVFDQPTASATRVKVLLNVLGRVNKVCISTNQLKKVASKKRPRRTRGRGRRIKKVTEN